MYLLKGAVMSPFPVTIFYRNELFALQVYCGTDLIVQCELGKMERNSSWPVSRHNPIIRLGGPKTITKSL
jgi:hypothetical protein